MDGARDELVERANAMAQAFRVMWQPEGRQRWLSWGRFTDESDAYVVWDQLKRRGLRAYVVFAS